MLAQLVSCFRLLPNRNWFVCSGASLPFDAWGAMNWTLVWVSSEQTAGQVVCVRVPAAGEQVVEAAVAVAKIQGFHAACKGCPSVLRLVNKLQRTQVRLNAVTIVNYMGPHVVYVA